MIKLNKWRRSENNFFKTSPISKKGLAEYLNATINSDRMQQPDLY